MCKLIGVSRSGYYKWLSYSKKSSDRGIKDRIIKDYIIEIHKNIEELMVEKEFVLI
ncbi:hypothetical protein KK437_13630 [Clostridioides difficile]|nr:hypothetical protein [Clostridioides difficile]